MMTAVWQDYVMQKVMGNTAVSRIRVCSGKHRMLCKLQDSSNKSSISMLQAKNAFRITFMLPPPNKRFSTSHLNGLNYKTKQI